MVKTKRPLSLLQVRSYVGRVRSLSHLSCLVEETTAPPAVLETTTSGDGGDNGPTAVPEEPTDFPPGNVTDFENNATTVTTTPVSTTTRTPRGTVMVDYSHKLWPAKSYRRLRQPPPFMYVLEDPRGVYKESRLHGVLLQEDLQQMR